MPSKGIGPACCKHSPRYGRQLLLSRAGLRETTVFRKTYWQSCFECTRHQTSFVVLETKISTPCDKAAPKKSFRIFCCPGQRNRDSTLPIDRALSAHTSLHVVQSDISPFLLLQLCRSFTAHQKRYTHILERHTRLPTLD